jgi:hypothetical protein
MEVSDFPFEGGLWEVIAGANGKGVTEELVQENASYVRSLASDRALFAEVLMEINY